MTLKDILYDMIHRHHTKSLEQIAEEIGMSNSYLARAALPDKDTVDNPDLATGVRFPLKKLIPLIRATDDFQLLDHIEVTLGRVAFSLPRRHPETTQELHQQLSDSIKEFGEFIAVVGDSIADGKLTVPERERCRKEGYDLIQVVSRLLCQLKLL